jgi:hypothetical protein
MRLCVSTGLACTQHGRVVLVYRFAAWLPDPMTSCAAPSLDDSTPCLTRQRLRPTPWTGFGLRFLCESLRWVLRTVMAGRHAISLRCSTRVARHRQQLVVAITITHRQRKAVNVKIHVCFVGDFQPLLSWLWCSVGNHRKFAKVWLRPFG